MLAEMVEHVIGIDPDRDWVTASVVDASTTRELASTRFGTTRVGYAQLLEWANQYTSTVERAWMVEGAGSYGAGAASYLSAAGELVRACIHVCVRWVFYCCGWCESRPERR